MAFSSIWLLVFSIPWENVIMVPGVGTISKALGLPVVLIGIYTVIYSQKVRFQSIHLLIIVFFVWASITYFWSINQDASQIVVFTFLQLVIMIWLVYQYCTGVKEVHSLMQAYVLGTFVAACATIYSFISGASVAYQRYAPTGFDANDVAVIIALGIPMAWYISLNLENKIIIWFYRIFLVVALYGIILTASRGGFIVSLIAISYIVLTFKFLSFKSKAWVLFATFLMAIVVIPFVPIESLARLGTIQSSINQGNIGGRVAIWQAGLASLSESSNWLSLLLGIGAGAFRYAVVPYLGGEHAAHNVYLCILVELGAIALLLFAAILTFSVRSAIQMPKLQRKLWLTLLTIWMVSAFTLNLEWQKDTWLLFGLIAVHSSIIHKTKSLISTS